MLLEAKRSGKALISNRRNRVGARRSFQNQIQKESEGANSDHAEVRNEEVDGKKSR